MLIRKIIGWLILLSLLLGLLFIWNKFIAPCDSPLEYSIGSFHPYFNLTEDEFRQEIMAAEKVWEQVIGQELFVYTPGAPFTINLIFDQRQIKTLAGQKLDQSLNETKARQEKLSEKNAESLVLYQATLKGYESLLSTFQKRLATYNAEVARLNKAGGATEKEYEALQVELQAIKTLEKNLENERQKVNALVEQVNQFSEEQVSVVNQYNSQVESYVRRYGEPRAFDQGEYVGTAINIYQFDDRARLRLVLAHELGHALGIGHVNDPTALMYHLMEQQDVESLRLTASDQAALIDVCAVSAQNFMRKLSVWYRLIIQS